MRVMLLSMAIESRLAGLECACWDAVTATALTSDDTVVYTVGKEGSIIKHNIETGQR